MWSVGTEQLLKHFPGHYGRIIRLSSLTEGKWNHAVTSSMDRTIKVWDLARLEEEVWPLDRQDTAVLSLLPCPELGVVVRYLYLPCIPPKNVGHFFVAQGSYVLLCKTVLKYMIWPSAWPAPASASGNFAPAA